MGRIGNGASSANGLHGVSKRAAAGDDARRPRRVVLLAGAEGAEIIDVLLELQGDDVSGKRLHAEVQRLAREHAGSVVAAEWLGPLGWTRFLWCKR
jgi:hypothetical protein